MTEKLEWILVTDRLPTKKESKKPVLASTKDEVFEAWFTNYGDFRRIFELYATPDVIAWMPMPNPPATKKNTKK